ncbi:hypothetical protein SAMN02745164_02046 [Marinitoga hydrogenitolerans DSM 16785]|uniref:HTH merR-type domain-containing protein n=2 Tax=Marinitoga TaxID=160798 RepID=A0A1M4ZYP3_MARH1|nr:hypothetical protein SAMN02745164_02046 [Marinitoga hydrogenitolerans DSM 16785]
MISIPYFCKKYEFNNPDVLRNLVKFLDIKPVTGNSKARGMRSYREKDLLFVLSQLQKMAEAKRTESDEL